MHGPCCTCLCGSDANLSQQLQQGVGTFLSPVMVRHSVVKVKRLGIFSGASPALSVASSHCYGAHLPVLLGLIVLTPPQAPKCLPLAELKGEAATKTPILSMAGPEVLIQGVCERTCI